MKTVFFSHEDDVHRALHQFENHPIHKTFSLALAHLTLQAAQKFLAMLQTCESMQSYWRHTNPHVVLFETTTYFWSLLSFDASQTVQYAFDEDKNAVKSAMLDALNQANAMIRDGWFGFSPEVYALSRLLLYPNDKSTAAERFFDVLAQSEGRGFPLFPNELPHAPAETPAVALELSHRNRAVYQDLTDQLHQAAAHLVACYLNDRLD